MKSTPAKLVEIGDAAKYFRVSRRKLYVLAEEKKIPHYRVGKRGVRFDIAELRQYFAARPTQ